MNRKLNTQFAIYNLDERQTHYNWFFCSFDVFPSSLVLQEVDIDSLEKQIVEQKFELLFIKDFISNDDAKTLQDDSSNNALDRVFSTGESGESDESLTRCYFHQDGLMIIIHPGEKMTGTTINNKEFKNHTVGVVTVLFNANDKFCHETTYKLRDFCVKNKEAVPENAINFLCHETGFYLKKVKLKAINVNLQMNYGEKFLSVHEKLISFLTTDKVGLCLLFGSPGTGKSSYIKHLLGLLKKRVIYVPPHLINSIAEPSFLPFLISYPDSVLIIEDAEEIITHRRDNVNSAGVANLLNLTDGILGDAVKMQIICTFNTDLKNIDPALKRKGRLALSHKFDKLGTDDANKLLKQLGKLHVTNEPMSLGDIYNVDISNNYEENKSSPIGFKIV